MEDGLTNTKAGVDNEVSRTSVDTVGGKTAELDKEQIQVKKHETVDGTAPETPSRQWENTMQGLTLSDWLCNDEARVFKSIVAEYNRRITLFGGSRPLTSK